MRGLAAIALFAAILCGCSASGPKVKPARYQLEGSLSDVMDLGFDECFLDTTSPDEIAVRFVRKRGDNDAGALEDTPLKIVWAQAGQELITPSTIDLAEPRPDDANRQRGIVSRNVLDDKRTVFPLMVRSDPAYPKGPGRMSFLDQIKPDSSVRGVFNITFENGIDFANGRTVFGSFTAKVPP